MDTLTKLKMLSDKLDNPIFASKFSKDFEEFLEIKNNNKKQHSEKDAFFVCLN